MAVPGLGTLARQELDNIQGVTVTGSGFDGRSDVILVDVERGHRESILALRSVEDVFVEVGRTLRSQGDKPHWIAGRIWRPERSQRALSVWSEEVRPLSKTMSFRVIARVLQEKSFLRTELRKSLTQAISHDKPKWSVADPARLEIWISEYRQGRLIAGLRLSDASMRQHESRVRERTGALRPTVAASMVALAGTPNGALLDPCCGAGTILSEALAVGWEAEGRDIDTEAVEASQENVPRANVVQGDVRELDLADASVGACVSNLPFGQQYGVQGRMEDWLRTVLEQMARVTRSGGRVVLLSPDIPRSVVPRELRFQAKYHLRLLGLKTVLWVFERTHEPEDRG